MLEIRPVCENCSKSLPNNSGEAMICTFECTYCKDCVNDILHNVCPNCGGGFEKRPIRPKEKLLTSPGKSDKYINPIDMKRFEPKRTKLEGIHPNER